jgi:CubicO group peptidase (beta-lactamase class C family)
MNLPRKRPPGFSLAASFLCHAVLLSSLAGNAAAEPVPAEAAKKALDGFDAVVAAALAEGRVPGMGVAVVAGGEVVYSKGFGFRDLERRLPMTADSLFAVGSTTKAMTATLLAMLVDQGKLEWDAPVQRYLPELRFADEDLTARISARDLLTHRTGLPRHDNVWYNNKRASREEIVARLEFLEPTADLRQKWQYNNLAFLLAGYLAGKLENRSWEEAMRDRLLGPLGMPRTVFTVDAMQLDADHALPYRLPPGKDAQPERIPYRNIDLVGPAGSLDSSVAEMSRWLLLNLQGGKIDGKQLIQPSTLAELHAPQMSVPNPPAPDTRMAQHAYGMGWVVGVYRGHKVVEHGGAIDGFTTQVSFFPDDGFGVVTFANRNTALPNQVGREIADRLLGLEKIEWIAEGIAREKAAAAAGAEAAKKVDTLRVAGTRPSHPLAAYAGSYSHPGYGMLEVKTAGAKNESLAILFNDIEEPLQHWHYDIFGGKDDKGGDATFDNMKFNFRTNLDGDIGALEAAFEPTAAEPIVFTKQADPRLADPAVLQRFTGGYAGPTGQLFEVELAGSQLSLKIPNQPTRPLLPQPSGRFALRGVQGVSIAFGDEKDGKTQQLTSYQPNGVFEFKRKGQ